MRSFYWLPVLASAFARADETEDIKWTSPQSGETFEPGQMITASWIPVYLIRRQSDQAIVSPSFSLCIEVDGGDDCGDAIWPSVSRNDSSSSYSMSIIAPNITNQASFFIKMKSDFGDFYTSPDFDLSPTEPSPTASSLLTSSTVSLFPSTTSPLPSSKDLSGTSRTNPLAIGIPLTMLGMALVGAFVFCLTRSRREQREAGGTAAGLNPVYSATRTVFSAPPAPVPEKGGGLETGEATFFNVSLNKTTSDLSHVEKAVCGAISAGSAAAARPVPVRQQESQRSSEVGSKSRTRDQGRRRLVDEDQRYTTPPPRTWQRQDSERHSASRSWALEKQLRRALERESDLQWEIERRELAWRKVNSSLPLHSNRRHESDDGQRYSVHSAPEYRRNSDLGSDRWPPPCRSTPYAFRRRSPDHLAREISYADPPKYRNSDPTYDIPMPAPIPRPPTAAETRSARYPPPEDDDMNATLTVVTAYCEPSPLIPFNDSSRAMHDTAIPSSTVMAELPTSLRAGGRMVQPASFHHPLRLERATRSQRRDHEYAIGGHPRFEFEQRDASQFRFSNMGLSQAPSKSYSSQYDPYGMYLPRNL